MTLRPYQERALAQLDAAFAAGKRRVVVVAPTGSGKGSCAAYLLAEAAARGERGLFLVHRREIVLDIAERVRALAPGRVGVLLAGHDADPHASIQIASVQTVLARDARPAADLIVADEVHHYQAQTFRSVLDAYPEARIVGFTATPERADGQALGDVFDHLIVAAQYSELLAAGHLVPCRVFQPPEQLGRDLAQEPLAAYQKIAPGSLAFCFVGGVQYAQAQRALFEGAGVPAAVVHAKTPKGERDGVLARFRAGNVRVIVNVATMTEGVDCPAASTAILARACAHASTYIQAAGRVLRPAPGKTHATLIDLTGASLRHGLPTADREYSLAGRAISEAGAPLAVCQACGLTFEGSPPCPDCGFAPPREAPIPPRIWSLELREVYAGTDTPADAMVREWGRLRALAASKQWSLGWAVREYQKLFSALPPVTLPEREVIYRGDAAFAATKGWKDGWAKHRYREMFGNWPPFRARAA